MRIDAHVHAFPKVVPDRLGKLAGKLGRLASPFLGIEKVAALKQQTGSASRRIEQVSSVALLGPVMLGGTTSGLLESMDAQAISRSILIGSRGVAGNDWLLAEARRNDRLIPVATLPDPPYLDAYERLARNGARGFKIHSNWDDLDANHAAIPALFEVAAKHKLFVILHTGCFHVVGYKRSEATDIASFERWFTAFPSVRVCLAHMNREHPEEAWAVMKRHEQVFADTSWQTAEAIRRAVATVGSERLMVGSDWPLLHLDLQRDAFAVAEQATSGKAQDDLFALSARRLLGEIS